MRLSRLLGKTLRQPPADAHMASHQLLVRAGYVRPLETGLPTRAFAYLPLGRLALAKLQNLVRVELERLGGQQIHAPALPDTEPTAMLVQLVSREIDSYRQLPIVLFQMHSHTEPSAGAKGGLFGATNRPAAQIHAFGSDDLNGIEPQITAALNEVWAACGVQISWADAGAKGRRAYFLHPSGDAELARCPSCQYAAERSWATTAWADPPVEPELPTAEIATPGCDTIATLAQFLDITPAQTLKMVFYSVESQVTCIVIRGDRFVDEAKLACVLGTDWYYTSLEDELDAVGAVGGYASPIGLDPSRVRVVADPSVRSGRNFVSGANRPDYHIQNVNIPRDFVPQEWADLALIEAGDPCPSCGTGLEVQSAFQVAHAIPTSRVDAEYLDSAGQGRPLSMASWQLDLGRLLAAVVEAHHDNADLGRPGLLWPRKCAPYDVHLVCLDTRSETVAAQADALYDQLQVDGFSVLYDDRDASAGVKFNDADLIGLPLRLTVSKRSLKTSQIEAKWRHCSERFNLDLAALRKDSLAAELARLQEG